MKVKKRWVAGLALLAAAVMLATAGWPKPGPTPENLQRLRKGMRREHAEAILGGPPTSGGCVSMSTMGFMGVWQGDGFSIVVVFDFDVVRDGWVAPPGEPRTFKEMLNQTKPHGDARVRDGQPMFLVRWREQLEEWLTAKF
jgi:hypothetical protein